MMDSVIRDCARSGQSGRGGEERRSTDPGRKSTLGAGLIGQEIVAGRSVGDFSRMVSGSSTWLWSALLKICASWVVEDNMLGIATCRHVTSR
jgi:hypothetical protein